jgi:hypothetical protein
MKMSLRILLIQIVAMMASPALGAPAVVGSWAARCHPSALIAEKWSDGSIDFRADATFRRAIRHYSDKTCSEVALIQQRTYEGTYALTGSVKGDPLASNVDFKIKDVFYTAYGAPAAQAFSNAKLCTAADWRSGEKRNVTGLLCDGYVMGVGSSVYDIVSVEDGRLFLGAKSFFRSGAKPGERPIVLDREVAYTPVTTPRRTTH